MNQHHRQAGQSRETLPRIAWLHAIRRVISLILRSALKVLPSPMFGGKRRNDRGPGVHGGASAFRVEINGASLARLATTVSPEQACRS